jgi:hypothetical protein
MSVSKRLDVRAERGFSMFVAIMTLAVTAMFVAAGFAAVNGDLPVSGVSKDRKATYAAAEAGLNFYLNHLQQDPDYWTLCDQAPAPNSTEQSPINQQYDGPVDPAHDPRVWRTVPGSRAQYTIELLHTKGAKNGCDRADQKSFVDQATGTFKLRITGRPYPNSNLHRSIVATFRRDSFLSFVYFTDYETGDPAASASATTRATIQSKCADKVRSLREASGCPYTNEITFHSGDTMNGPSHTNDESLFVCGTVSFGRDKTITGAPMNPRSDTTEVRGPLPGHGTNPNAGCADTSASSVYSPTGFFTPNARYLGIPQSNQKIADVAKNNGSYFEGKTIIRLNNSTMDVTNYKGGVAATQTGLALPANGVIYVDNDSGPCTTETPVVAVYNEQPACGNVYVSGTYGKSLTIAARNDVIVAPTQGAVISTTSNDANIVAAANSDATMGLIADNFVRIMHRVDRTKSCGGGTANVSPVLNDLRVEAAILSVKHSVTVDNWDCGRLGTLTVLGAIAQKYRGIVQTFQGTSVYTGYVKNYWYDDRLRYRSPPYFLDPVDSAWDVVRVHEQVQAR